jgi:hypothetical protein
VLTKFRLELRTDGCKGVIVTVKNMFR